MSLLRNFLFRASRCKWTQLLDYVLSALHMLTGVLIELSIIVILLRINAPQYLFFYVFLVTIQYADSFAATFVLGNLLIEGQVLLYLNSIRSRCFTVEILGHWQQQLRNRIV